MAWQHGYKTVTDGLVLYIDAANSRSYPGTGTTWHDVSNYNNHGTLSDEGIGWPTGTSGSDVDGNAFPIVRLGSKFWMAENLKTTKYNDGTGIPRVDGDDDATWSNATTGMRCEYNDDASSESDTYGYLYNGYTVDTGNLAPDGWHVPTDEEFKELEMHLGMTQLEADDVYNRGTNQGAKLAGNAGLWNNGNLESDSEFGTSGFNGLPSGYRYTNGAYNNINFYGQYWTSTEEDGDPDNRWQRMLYWNNTYVNRSAPDKNYGFSVRCVYDHRTSHDASMTFDGQSDYVAIPHNSSYKPTDALTVSCWGWSYDWSSLDNENQKLFSCTEGSGWNITFGHETMGGHNGAPDQDTVTALVRSNSQYNVVNGPLLSELSNGWVYFTMTFDKEYLRLYINGVLVGSQSTTATGDIEYVDNYLFIGAEAGGVSDGNTPAAGGYFNGRVGTFSVHNKALSVDEILQNYNALKWRFK